MEKSLLFKRELNFIKNDALRAITIVLINQLPEYFFKVPASSTGKYHPTYALGEQGLVRHTQAAVRIAVEMLRLEQNTYLSKSYDFIIMALLLHDGFKHGYENEEGEYSQYCVARHPKLIYEFLTDSKTVDLVVKELQSSLTKDYVASVLNYVAYLALTHMGQWNDNPKTGEIIALKPDTADRQFVHLCDYLASRKCLEVNLDAILSE